MSEWISVKERLPLINETKTDFHFSEPVLVYTHDKIYIGTCDDRLAWDLFGSKDWNIEVTHWMPLPLERP